MLKVFLLNTCLGVASGPTIGATFGPTWKQCCAREICKCSRHAYICVFARLYLKGCVHADMHLCIFIYRCELVCVRYDVFVHIYVCKNLYFHVFIFACVALIQVCSIGFIVHRREG